MTAILPLNVTPGCKPAPPLGAAPSETSFADMLDSAPSPTPPLAVAPGPNRPAMAPGLMTSLPAAVDVRSFASSDPQPAEPAALFDAVKPVPQQDRLFRFDALGMFGQYAASASPAGPATTVAPSGLVATVEPSLESGQGAAMPIDIRSLSIALRTTAVSIATVQPSLQLPSAATVQQEGVTAHPDDAALFTAVSSAATQGERQIAPAETAPSSTISEIDAAEPILASAGSGKLPTRAQPTPNPLSLLVAGPEGALSIVVGTEAGADYAALRRAASDTAREFGMDVADFQLNGAPSQLSFATISGGSRGSRTR